MLIQSIDSFSIICDFKFFRVRVAFSIMFDPSNHRQPTTPNKKRHTLPLKEAPVYKPNIEEAKDPLAFIEKIRKEAEYFGICKIILPDGASEFKLNPVTIKFLIENIS